MRYILFVGLVFLTNCSHVDKKSTDDFVELIGKKTVEIYLSDYSLKSIAENISALTKTKKLIIAKDSSDLGWIVYPPEG